MKTIIKIEIETPDTYDVLPEEHLSGEEELSDEELKEHQKQFAEDVHSSVISEIRQWFENDYFEEQVMDNMEECYVESWDTFADYKIKWYITEEK